MRKFLTIVSLVAAAAGAAAERKPFTVVEASIPEMQKAMREKRVTSRELVQQYLTRIALYNGRLHATISVNPNALKEAEEVDRDRGRDPPEAADGRAALFPGGSSSGIGTAANLWAANVGTETSGSILTPSNAMMLAGIKPTVGRVSRYGVIPITADQDTAGPMAK